MSHYFMTIAGAKAESTDSFGVINPATGEQFAQCPSATRGQLNEAVLAAKQALTTWSVDEAKRRELLQQCADAILAHKGSLAELLTLEQGKPLAAATVEVESSAAKFSDAAKFALPVDVLQDDDDIRVEVHRRPIGVVAAITPWNFPLLMAAKVATPLLVGNTVVIKPSPNTPLTSLRFGEILCEILPAGVINVITGGDELGAWLTEHSLVNKINFTGSVPTGKRIAAVAAEDLKRVTLELGGNDPAIVFDDVDVSKAAETIFWGAFNNSGQVCIATKRLYVQEGIFNQLVEALVQVANTVKVGPGLEPDMQMGPLNNKNQLNIVSSLVEDARKHGAEVLTGGEPLQAAGYFYPPTLITNIKEGVRLVDEEQFGPVLPIMSFVDEQEVISRANNSHLGLAACVWSNDLERAKRVASQIQSGVVTINSKACNVSGSPFGGFKHSGVGREGGIWGVDAMSEVQTITTFKKG